MADNFDFAALAKSWQQQTTPIEQAPSAKDLAKARQRQKQQRQKIKHSVNHQLIPSYVR